MLLNKGVVVFEIREIPEGNEALAREGMRMDSGFT